MSPIPLPDPSDWSGRDRPFASAEQKAAMVNGQPFMIFDALANFGQENQCAYLVQLLDPSQRLEGETFVFSRNPSPTRLRLVELAQSAAADDDVVGPAVIRHIPSTDPARKPFQAVVAYRADDGDSSDPPARARAGAARARTQEIDPDDIPF